MANEKRKAQWRKYNRSEKGEKRHREYGQRRWNDSKKRLNKKISDTILKARKQTKIARKRAEELNG